MYKVMFAYNFDSGDNYAEKIVAVTFLANREKKTQKSQKLRPTKIKCHTVERIKNDKRKTQGKHTIKFKQKAKDYKSFSRTDVSTQA